MKNKKPLSVRLISMGLICFVIGALGESIRIGWAISDVDEILANADGMAEIKEPLHTAVTNLGGSISLWQGLMLLGVIVLTAGLLTMLAKLAQTRDEVISSGSGGCGGCH
ncbi:MAG: hypothetical protein L3J39_12735 [Verrucomicrobiales bacterium]|nr:hypothetical protein [Verrucomicrobiales bacterium]